MPYLADNCQLVADVGRRRLRSADSDTFVGTQSCFSDSRLMLPVLNCGTVSQSNSVSQTVLLPACALQAIVSIVCSELWHEFRIE